MDVRGWCALLFFSFVFAWCFHRIKWTVVLPSGGVTCLSAKWHGSSADSYCRRRAITYMLLYCSRASALSSASQCLLQPHPKRSTPRQHMALGEAARGERMDIAAHAAVHCTRDYRHGCVIPAHALTSFAVSREVRHHDAPLGAV